MIDDNTIRLIHSTKQYPCIAQGRRRVKGGVKKKNSATTGCFSYKLDDSHGTSFINATHSDAYLPTAGLEGGPLGRKRGAAGSGAGSGAGAVVGAELSTVSVGGCVEDILHSFHGTGGTVRILGLGRRGSERSFKLRLN